MVAISPEEVGCDVTCLVYIPTSIGEKYEIVTGVIYHGEVTWLTKCTYDWSAYLQK